MYNPFGQSRKAYDEGYNARISNYPAKNPYTTSGINQIAWSRGFEDGGNSIDEEANNLKANIVLQSESIMSTKISLNLESDLVSALKNKAREISFLEKRTVTVSDLIRDALHEKYGEKNESRFKQNTN